MRKLLCALPLLFAVPLIAQSATQMPGTMDVARVTAGTYNTDPGHTLIGWRVSHFGFNDYFGIFGDATGTLILDPANPNAAKVEITIPVGKVTTASAGLTGHLLRAGKDGGKADFFGPAPADAKFVSTRVVTSGTTAKISGDLTLNGVTKPVVLIAEELSPATVEALGPDFEIRSCDGADRAALLPAISVVPSKMVLMRRRIPVLPFCCRPE